MEWDEFVVEVNPMPRLSIINCCTRCANPALPNSIVLNAPFSAAPCHWAILPFLCVFSDHSFDSRALFGKILFRVTCAIITVFVRATRVECR